MPVRRPSTRRHWCGSRRHLARSARPRVLLASARGASSSIPPRTRVPPPSIACWPGGTVTRLQRPLPPASAAWIWRRAPGWWMCRDRLRPAPWRRANGRSRRTTRRAKRRANSRAERRAPGGLVTLARTQVRELVSAHGHSTAVLHNPPSPSARRRVGLYKSWVANMDEGWTRWLLEQYAFPYTHARRPRHQGGRSARALRRHRPAAPVARRHRARATSRAAVRGATARRTRCLRSTRAGIGDAGVRCAEALRAPRAARSSRSTRPATWCSTRFGGVFERITDVTRGPRPRGVLLPGLGAADRRRHAPAGRLGDGRRHGRVLPGFPCLRDERPLGAKRRALRVRPMPCS